MMFVGKKRKDLLDRYRTTITSGLEHLGFELYATPSSGSPDAVEATFRLARVGNLESAGGFIRGLALSYGRLCAKDAEQEVINGHTYQFTFTASVTQTHQKGVFDLLVRDSGRGKFGQSGKYLMRAVAPLEYFSPQNLFSLMLRAFMSIQEVEVAGDSDTLWLVSPPEGIAEPNQRLMCNLLVMHPERGAANEPLVREAQKILSNGYRI